VPKGSVHYLGAMAFEAESESGHRVTMDSAPETGGANRGFRPTELTALSLAGCTAMDVISILQKMRCTVRRFDVHVNADRREQHPRVFTDITLVFELDGDCRPDQFQRAVMLSAERYCSVSAMLEKTATIRRILKLNGETLEAVPEATSGR
jgi:putative redox protein